MGVPTVCAPKVAPQRGQNVRDASPMVPHFQQGVCAAPAPAGVPQTVQNPAPRKSLPHFVQFAIATALFRRSQSHRPHSTSIGVVARAKQATAAGEKANFCRRANRQSNPFTALSMPNDHLDLIRIPSPSEPLRCMRLSRVRIINVGHHVRHFDAIQIFETRYPRPTASRDAQYED